ncbi:MAG: efflux RND transporter permease subunit [Candidatus Limnocylindrales bacterium]
MSRLTELAVSKRSVTLLLAFGVFMAGIFSWGQLNQELVPNVNLPIITVIASLPGAGATDVTEQVTKPIERAVASVPRLEHVQSTSSNSISVVVAQFSYGTDVKSTQTSIDQALGAVQLPAGVTPQVTALDINATPVITAGIQGAGATSPDQVAQLAQNVVVPELQGLAGVGQVSLTGGATRVLQVTLDPARLAADGISVEQVAGILQANNITIPAGSLSQGSASIPVSALHQFASLDEIRNLVVGIQGGSQATAAPGSGTAAAGTGFSAGSLPAAQLPTPTEGRALTAPTPIRLGDIASVEVTDVQSTGYARLNGAPAITITVSKTTDANTVNVANAVEAKFASIEAQYGSQLRITTVDDLSSFIKESRDGLLREGGLGATFAILTIFLFLLSVRSTFVAAMSIPISLLAAIALMLATGITINIMTLGGLAVAVGRVVDDAIVVLENIYRHRAQGETIGSAVVSGPREVAGAITSSTLTTVAVFLPLGLVGGIVSQFFLPFALTVTFALLASLVVALTVVPVLAYFLIGSLGMRFESGPPKDTIWQRLYTPTLRFALRNRVTRWGVVVLAALLFVGSSALIPTLPTQFLNSGSEKFLQVAVSPPIGTASSAVLARAEQAERILRADPEVVLIATSVPGEGDTGVQTLSAAFSGSAANSAQLLVKLTPSTSLDAEQGKLQQQLRPLLSEGYAVDVQQQNFGGGSTVDVTVSGSDTAQVKSVSQALLSELQAMPDLSGVKSDLVTAAPEIQINVDPNRAIAAGLTTAQVGADVRTLLVGQTLTRVQVAGEPPLDLQLRVDPSTLTGVTALRQIPVGTTNHVPLGAIATVQRVDAQARVTRVDQSPAATISGNITVQDQGAVSREIQQKIDALTASGKAQGVTITLGGVSQQQSQAFSGLFFAMGVAILLVYVVMVLVFDSLIDPFVILFSLPLATIGAFVALYATHRAIGISALIGFLMLIGIVVTNAIVLLDLVEQLRRRGLSTQEALIEGGRTRVRPILMTAIATILALLPLGLGLNQGSIIASELATVVIGGLFSSTFLTLVVVPVVYSLVEGGKDWVSERRGPVLAAGDAEAATGVGSGSAE